MSARILAAIFGFHCLIAATGAAQEREPSRVQRVIGPDAITFHGSSELLAGLRHATVNVEWRGTEGMRRPFSDRLMRVTIEAHLRREGLSVSDNPRVLFDSGGVEVSLHISSFEVVNGAVTVSSMILMVTDMAIVRRAPRLLAIVPTWLSGNAVRASPTNQHESAVLESLRTLLDAFTITMSKAPATIDPPPTTPALVRPPLPPALQ